MSDRRLPWRRLATALILSLSALGAAASLVRGGSEPLEIPTAPARAAGPRIDAVFFAQHHVLEPESPYFGLVGGLETLIKVQVYAETPTPSPYVFARLALDGRSREIRLLGPAMLPARGEGDPLLMVHAYYNSFTAFIPPAWIHPGLRATVELRDYDYADIGADDYDYDASLAADRITVYDRRVIDDLKVGAPTRLVVNMFDFSYFGRGTTAEYPEGWERELASKLPVAEFVVHRAPKIVMDEIVMPPIRQRKIPSARYTSTDDYKQRTGLDYDGEQGVALRWTRALKRAGGRETWWRFCVGNICGVHAGGQGGAFMCVNSMHRHGLIIHEMGHGFRLPHWAGSTSYPYKRSMYGSDQGQPARPNAGPHWAFDMHRREFIPPRRLRDGRLIWKNDPMQGGGWSRQPDYLYNYFSDYSMMRIRDCLENRAIYWNDELGQYARWNEATGAYDQVVENDGLRLPLERDVGVISILVTASLATPEANIVYAPIGPYTGGLIRRFDATSPEARAAAAALGYSDENCNVCLRVTQGGRRTTYLLDLGISPDDDPLRSFHCTAINLPARDGTVTRAELLYAPAVISEGVTPAARVLDAWEGEPVGPG